MVLPYEFLHPYLPALVAGIESRPTSDDARQHKMHDKTAWAGSQL